LRQPQLIVGAAAGNSIVGIIALGYTTVAVTTRDKYTYYGDTVSSGTAASTASYDGSATGNSTVGIFALGYNATINISTRDQYTYYGDVVATGTVASTASALRCSGWKFYKWYIRIGTNILLLDHS